MPTDPYFKRPALGCGNCESILRLLVGSEAQVVKLEARIASLTPKPLKIEKPTYDSLKNLLEQYNEPAKLMLKEQFNLPVVLRYVAEDIFLNGDVNSELAQIVRHQLKHLHDNGVFDIQR